MANTDISICSNALLMLGDAPISSFDEGGSPTNIRRSQLVGNLWPQVRDHVLRAKPWNCCRKRVLLAPESATPAWGYTAQFVKPGDWLRTILVGYEGTHTQFRDEGGRILCSTNALPLLYVFRNEVPATYDSLLVDVLTLAMAARMCYAITKSAAQQRNQVEMLREAWIRAGSVDGQDDGPEDIGSFDLLTARLTGGYSFNRQ
jgi:hypothetical protein